MGFQLAQSMWNAAQVLHDFCVSRSDYQGAAAAQLALARRLRDDASAAPGTPQAVATALGAHC